MSKKLNNYKDKLKEKGYAKREIWVPENHISSLKKIEKMLRSNINPLKKGNNMSIGQLFNALLDTDEVANHVLKIELLGETIHAQVTDYEDFPVYVTESGEQVLAVSYLWDSDNTEEEAELNKDLLRANPIVPLSAFALVGNSYVLFGALSTSSQVQEVVTEIVTLAENTVDAWETYGPTE